MISKRSIFFLIAVLFGSAAITFAQNASDPIKPKWLHILPKETNSTFIYQVVSSSAYSLEDARSMTLQTLINDAGMKSGVVIVSDHKSVEKVSQVWENGKLREVINNDMQTVNTAKGHEIPLHASLIDEYWKRDQNGLYHVQRLYAKSELGKMPLYDDIKLTTSYASDQATWGLALIPGAAQFHKGSYLKGGLVLGGSVALAGGSLACGLMRKDNMAKYQNVHNTSVKEQYRTRINGLNTGMYCCIGGLAALYIYNIIDAIVALGARRIIVYPAASTDGSVGLGATVKF